MCDAVSMLLKFFHTSVTCTLLFPLEAANPCAVNNGGCSHLCLPSVTAVSGYSCACPTGLTATEDHYNCSSESTVTGVRAA